MGRVLDTFKNKLAEVCTEATQTVVQRPEGRQVYSYRSLSVKN